MSDIDLRFKEGMEQGIELDGKKTLPCSVELLGGNRFKITLTQGLNRQIRRMCRALSYHVTDLQRVSIVNLQLAELALNDWRFLNEEEISELFRLVIQPDEGVNG